MVTRTTNEPTLGICSLGGNKKIPPVISTSKEIFLETEKEPKEVFKCFEIEI